MFFRRTPYEGLKRRGTDQEGNDLVLTKGSIITSRRTAEKGSTVTGTKATLGLVQWFQPGEPVAIGVRK